MNGRVAKLGDRADPMHDEIRVDGERLARERPAYWILNKPRGVVTTVRDEAGRRTVVDLLPPRIGRLFPVGRLDRETSGLLLMTNDGDAAHVLLHPSLGNEREYRVQREGPLDARTIKRLERGVSSTRAAPHRCTSQRRALRFGDRHDVTRAHARRGQEAPDSAEPAGARASRFGGSCGSGWGRSASAGSRSARRPLRSEEKRRALLEHVGRLRRRRGARRPRAAERQRASDGRRTQGAGERIPSTSREEGARKKSARRRSWSRAGGVS